MDALLTLVAEDLARPAPPPGRSMAQALATRFEGAAAILFYGSVLRTGDLDGVMDFYVLTHGPRPGWRGLAGRVLWPDVSYHELEIEGRVLRAKVATMTLAQFQSAVTGRRIDTTIWTRFVQPAALVWSSGAETPRHIAEAVATAACAATRFAAALGPLEGGPLDFWRALFQQTYAAEFRVEARGRENDILGVDPGRYERLLQAAWRAQGLRFEAGAQGAVRPVLAADERGRILAAWRRRRALGKPLNLARLAKAAFTFEGAARYAAWKIERHTGLRVPLTPWREKHPILASPGVFWRLWKARRAQTASGG
ncbi:hypothetical protein [Phenylobacterium sp.]|uniref:hypothetical protein n=1 Tax=Phenylobacterium sp. TaxID=1871053 RepID=UPI00273147C0|nr:hypothetical protein [Phenylobacterium sp.]MDP1618445.1 hypothetical protein [Phenylobacterium sp.]MDP1988062.1 hypothetical protein [Phenylobacterium sp.]